MQVSGAGMNAVYAAAMRSPQAQINPEVNGATTEAAAQAQAAMYGLSEAMSNLAQSAESIASGQLLDAVDIMA